MKKTIPVLLGQGKLQLVSLFLTSLRDVVLGLLRRRRILALALDRVALE